ncbi:MAG: hypothetical protein MUC49_21195 [Raineya sp.]|jgi:hypothetical protein|nr:hypothetical protein [Raineya sp.]
MPTNQQLPPQCLTEGTAFIELGTGNAPVLDYNLPQKSSFTSYGVFPLYLHNVIFNSIANQIPAWLEALLANPTSTTDDTIKNTILDELNYGNSSSQFLQSGFGVKPKHELLEQLAGNTPKLNFLARKIKQGNALLLNDSFGGFNQVISLIKRPTTPEPRFYVIEEYKTVSFLGNYGAGKTLKTFTMLPGEETTIAVKTYREESSTQSRSDNVVDSFSKSSAEEMEKLLETENSTSMQNTTNKTKSANVGLSFPKIGLSAGGSASKSSQSVRQANTKSLNKALEKSVENSNSSRNVTVNTSSSTTAKEGEEETITRVLKNVNQSCTLNVVFRQLLQEYITITYLDNIKVGFTNGHPEFDDIVPIEELDSLLVKYIKLKDDENETSPNKPLPTENSAIVNARNAILFEYQSVRSYTTGEQAFLEKVEKVNFSSNDISYYTKVANLEDTYNTSPSTPETNMVLKVPGIIQSVEKFTLRTDSLVADCFLGHGVALDCFSAKIQDADANKMALENEKTRVALEILSGITDPVAKAEAYAKMFNPPKTV